MSGEFARGVAFVQRAGGTGALVRLRHLLTGTAPGPDEIAELLAGQRADGGWAPFWARDYSSLDATCFRLAQAEQAGIPHDHLAIQRAAAFLAGRQRVDGCWEEAAAIAASAPLWASPGDSAARLYLTANCGFWLVLLVPHDAAGARAGQALSASVGNGGRLPSFAQTQWLAAALWYRLGERAAAERICAGLLARLDELPASSLAWLLTALLMVGVSVDQPLLARAADLLLHAQRADGAWPSEDGATQEAHVTLEALRALRLCGRI